MGTFATHWPAQRSSHHPFLLFSFCPIYPLCLGCNARVNRERREKTYRDRRVDNEGWKEGKERNTRERKKPSEPTNWHYGTRYWMYRYCLSSFFESYRRLRSRLHAIQQNRTFLLLSLSMFRDFSPGIWFCSFSTGKNGFVALVCARMWCGIRRRIGSSRANWKRNRWLLDSWCIRVWLVAFLDEKEFFGICYFTRSWTISISRLKSIKLELTKYSNACKIPLRQ